MVDAVLNVNLISVTAEDYAPLLIAFLSGFLQQWLGPKRILQLTTIPYIASFLMVALAPDNWVVVVCSRFMTGVVVCSRFMTGCCCMFQVHGRNCTRSSWIKRLRC